MIKKLILLLLVVVGFFLVSCTKDNDKESDFSYLEDYNYGLVVITEVKREDKGWIYKVEIDDASGYIYSDNLFSVDETALIIEINQDKRILIKLRGNQ